MLLTKSDYMLYLKHPAWLWLKKHDKYSLPEVDDNLQAKFDAGNNFEIHANKHFPNAVTIGFTSYPEYIRMPSATKEALATGAETLLQPRFEIGNLTCICDVVDLVAPNTFDLYEIKAASTAKLDHELDLAFQLHVLEACGYEVRNIYVIHINSEYVKNGPIDYKSLTTITDVTALVKPRRSQTKQNIQKALDVINQPARPDISPSLCNGYIEDWLQIYRSLTYVPLHSIYDLCSVKAAQLKELEQLGITIIKDIPASFDLTDKQRRQVEVVKSGTVSIDHHKIKKFLNNLTYPLYFLDYETMMSAVPYFDGTKPHQQIPFQYSLHVLDKPGGELTHLEYLHRDNTNPAEGVAKSLTNHIGKEGTVLTWYQSFESGCNKLLGLMVPESWSFFHNINERIDDLILPFSNGWYVHQDFCGSASIKKVLPALIPELSYKNLGIQEGGAAQRLWMEAVLDGKRSDQKEKILDDLVEYCTLDTLAMVRIYEHLQLVTQATLPDQLTLAV